MASHGGLHGIVTGLTKSTDHPSTGLPIRPMKDYQGLSRLYCSVSHGLLGSVASHTAWLFWGIFRGPGYVKVGHSSTYRPVMTY